MSKFTLDRCICLRCSLTKNALVIGFIRARSFSHALTARSSSPRRGWVVDNPLFNRATCSTRLSVSTWSSFIRQASDTRNPCRNIRSNKQRSRTSFLLSLVASINRSTSREVRCFRSLISASPRPVFPPKSAPVPDLPFFPFLACLSFCREFTLSDAPETRMNRGGDFSTIYKRDHFVDTLRVSTALSLSPRVNAWLEERTRMNLTGKTFFISEQRWGGDLRNYFACTVRCHFSISMNQLLQSLV